MDRMTARQIAERLWAEDPVAYMRFLEYVHKLDQVAVMANNLSNAERRVLFDKVR